MPPTVVERDTKVGAASVRSNNIMPLDDGRRS